MVGVVNFQIQPVVKKASAETETAAESVKNAAVVFAVSGRSINQISLDFIRRMVERERRRRPSLRHTKRTTTTMPVGFAATGRL